MTIKDVAQRTRLTNAAIYKRIKAKGVKLDAIKDKKTGHFTADGERLIIELFNLDDAAETATETPKTEVDNQVEKLTTRVAELTTEVEKLTTRVAELTTEVEKLTTKVELLTSERDNLRATLEREQQLHAMTLTKLLPSGDQGEKGRIRAAWDALRGRR